MNGTPIETQARHQIAERIARASTPQVMTRMPRTSGRHALARGMRRWADRLDS